jgi:uncharacterized membrane protein YeaQ/YmgE (transglycosylase-associated protein family)
MEDRRSGTAPRARSGWFPWYIVDDAVGTTHFKPVRTGIGTAFARSRASIVCQSHQIKALENFAMGVILFILFGLVVGLIARALMPGRQPMGFILTAIIGMVGSFVGSFIGGLIQGDEGVDMQVADPYNWIGAVLGTLLLLFLYGMFASKKTTV